MTNWIPVSQLKNEGYSVKAGVYIEDGFSPQPGYMSCEHAPVPEPKLTPIGDDKPDLICEVCKQEFKTLFGLRSHSRKHK